jgi:hypothetical protein
MIIGPFPRQKQLRRYKRPQYPRSMDASPIDISDPASYPLRQSKLKPALGFLLSASVGATGCMGNDLANRAGAAVDPSPTCPTVTCPVCETPGTTGEELPPGTNPESPPLCDSTVENPNGMPGNLDAWGVISGKGTGMALAESEVAGFVLAAFAQEGVPLESNSLFNEEGVATELDGFNKEKGIGFEFISEWDSQPAVWDAQTGETRYEDDDPMKVSYPELEKMHALEKAGQAHILTIGAGDDRFSEGGFLPDSPQTKEAALYNMAKHVHAYVTWLRSQGVL